MSPDKERRELPKRKAPGKDGLESGEEGGLLVVQHGEHGEYVQQGVMVVTLVDDAVEARHAQLSLGEGARNRTLSTLKESWFHVQGIWSAANLLFLFGWSLWG